MIRSIAFHPKAMNDINNNGRFSYLFSLLRLPRVSNNQRLRNAQKLPPPWGGKN